MAPYPDKLTEHTELPHVEQKRTFANGQSLAGFNIEHFNVGMHDHDFFEINIILKGSGVHYIENQKLMTEMGDVFIIPPFVKHGYFSLDDSDVYHLILHNDFFARFSSDLNKIPFFLLYSI